MVDVMPRSAPATGRFRRKIEDKGRDGDAAGQQKLKIGGRANE